jgi:Cu(I)/Ag(I) efflux system membrane protein CusA/SilA
VGGAVALVPRIGTEFMPPLNEGDLMFMPVTDPAISLTQAVDIVKKQNAAIARTPEVATVVAKIARADTSTDPAPVNMTETVVSLKPEAKWRPGMTREKPIAELDEATTLPGVSNIWTQPIINRINMLTTGIRSEVGVKVFGSDLKVLEESARAVAEALRTIPGAADVYPEQVTGAPYLDVRVNRDRLRQQLANLCEIEFKSVESSLDSKLGPFNVFDINLNRCFRSRFKFFFRDFLLYILCLDF